MLIAAVLAIALAACGTGGGSEPASSSASSSNPQQAAQIEQIVEGLMESQHLKSVIVRVTDDGQEVTTKAFG